VVGCVCVDCVLVLARAQTQKGEEDPLLSLSFSLSHGSQRSVSPPARSRPRSCSTAQLHLHWNLVSFLLCLVFIFFAHFTFLSLVSQLRTLSVAGGHACPRTQTHRRIPQMHIFFTMEITILQCLNSFPAVSQTWLHLRHACLRDGLAWPLLTVAASLPPPPQAQARPRDPYGHRSARGTSCKKWRTRDDPSQLARACSAVLLAGSFGLPPKTPRT
jgi:hypothetical protein